MRKGENRAPRAKIPLLREMKVALVRLVDRELFKLVAWISLAVGENVVAKLQNLRRTVIGIMKYQSYHVRCNPQLCVSRCRKQQVTTHMPTLIILQSNITEFRHIFYRNIVCRTCDTIYRQTYVSK